MKYGNLIGKTVKIKDVPQNSPCYKCTPCMRLRLMELGLFEGQKIELCQAALQSMPQQVKFDIINNFLF